MELLPHQQRVIEEYQALSAKLVALNTFVASEQFDRLTAAERGLLIDQAVHMRGYFSALKQRIDLWL